MAFGSNIGFSNALGDPFRPASNIQAMNALNNLSAINRELSVRQLRMATGRAQPRMEDGPSFFSIQNKMRNQVRGKQMALDNIADAKDMLALGEQGLLQIDDLLGTMRDLVVRGASDTLTAEQRDDMNREIRSLAMAIDLVADTTEFNETGAMLNDSFTATFQVGPNETASDMIMIQLGDFNAEPLGVELGENEPDDEGNIPPFVNVLDNPSSKRSIARIDNAINRVKDQLNEIGGFQRKLTTLQNILSASMAVEESQASRFGDADLAKEQTAIARLQLMQQLATQQLAAANIAPAQVLGGLLARR
jgi:flagellin